MGARYQEVAGKLSFLDDLIEALTSGGMTPLAIEPHHGESASKLPLHHRDPFDRMLIAQAQDHSLLVATADRAFSDYDVEVLTART